MGQPPDWAVALLAATASGCSGNASQFAGTWNETAQISVTCAGSGATTEPVQDSVVITVVSGSTLKLAQSNGCEVTLAVSGDLATAERGQKCVTTDQYGLKTTATVQSYVLTLSRDGGSMAVSETEDESQERAGACGLPCATTVDCVASGAGELQKE